MAYVKTENEIQAMRHGGKILAEIIKKLSSAVAPGVATKDLDKLSRELVFSYPPAGGVKPAFLGYGGFPATVCISVNDEVVHGVPSARVLKQDDIVGIDMGIIYHGLNVDSAVTVPVLGTKTYQEWAKENPELDKLLRVTREALGIGIKQARAGRRVGEIGHAVQEFVEKNGFSVVRDLVGHGIGKRLHEEPAVPNYGNPTDGPKLAEGVTIAIEPMVNIGDWHVKTGHDGFTYQTTDGSYSAHFEHTILVTRKNPEILTLIKRKGT